MAYPNKKDFSNAFIQVAKKGNPAIVAIISEKTIENNYHFFFDSFDNNSPNNQKLKTLYCYYVTYYGCVLGNKPKLIAIEHDPP